MKILLTICAIVVTPTLLLGDSIAEFGKEIRNFRLAPDKERFDELQRQVGKLEEEFYEQGKNAALLASVVIAKISQKYSWPILGDNRIVATAKEISIGQSGLARYIADDKQVDPGKLDVWWVGYFVTGEREYLEKILAYAGEELSENNMDKMLLVNSATWSFKSNCKQYESIRQFAAQCLGKERYAQKRAYLQSCVGMAEQPEFSWRDSNGDPMPDTESRKSKDGFGAELILTKNTNFYAEWEKPDPPRISVAEDMKIGTAVLPLVIYVNPQKDAEGNIDVTCDITIFRPDGSIAQEIPDLSCGKGSFKSSQFNLQLSRTELKWIADEGNPVGTWKFGANVKDNIRGIEIPLTTSIEIVNETGSRETR